jgi:hypothetical protein
MSNRKITDMVALTAPASDDVLPIVDISEAAAVDKNKKISIEELFKGVPDGTAAAPSIAFESNNDSGIFLAGTDTVGITTAGTQRVTVDGSGNVTIDGDLTVNGATTTIDTTSLIVEDKNIEMGVVSTPTNTTADGGGITLKGATDKTITWVDSTGCWTFNQPTNFNDHVRIDSSGRLLVGTSSSVVDAGKFQVKTQYNGALNQQGVTFLHGAFSPADTFNINLARSRDNFGGDSTVINGTRLGQINFKGYDGTDYESSGAAIYAEVDGNPGSNDMPGRLVAATTADGASSPTERLRIDSSGRVMIGTTTNNGAALTVDSGGGSNVVIRDNSIENHKSNSNGAITVNYKGYASGTTQFRDFHVYNGKTGQIATFDGSTNCVGIGVTTPGDADEGAGLQVRKYIDRNAAYFAPDGHYAGSFGYTNNTQDKVWIAVDSNYAKSSAVSAGLFLSAFHQDAGGSGCGSTIKNLKTGNALTFSTVTTASGTGSPAVETERMRLTSDGSLLVGRTTAINSEKGLCVEAVESNGGRGVVHIRNSSSTYDLAPALVLSKSSSTTSSSARFLQFYANNASTPMGGIVGNGASNVQFASISDIRDKENIQPITGVLSKIKQLGVVSYDWKNNGGHVKAGFIAQNVETVFPEYVVENMSSSGAEPRKGITGGLSSGYIAVLTAALQEAIAKIETLEAKVAALEAG